MIVRRATRADVPAVVRLLDQLSRDGERRERDPADPAYARAFDAIAADPRQRLYVVEQDGVIVATGTIAFLANLSHGGRPIARVESVVVDAHTRGRGVGAALMRRLVDDARAHGCFRVELTSNLARTDAHRFYERLGFVHSHAGFKLAL